MNEKTPPTDNNTVDTGRALGIAGMTLLSDSIAGTYGGKLVDEKFPTLYNKVADPETTTLGKYIKPKTLRAYTGHLGAGLMGLGAGLGLNSMMNALAEDNATAPPGSGGAKADWGMLGSSLLGAGLGSLVGRSLRKNTHLTALMNDPKLADVRDNMMTSVETKLKAAGIKPTDDIYESSKAALIDAHVADMFDKSGMVANWSLPGAASGAVVGGLSEAMIHNAVDPYRSPLQ